MSMSESSDKIEVSKQTLFNVVVLAIVLGAIAFFAHQSKFASPDKLPLPVYPDRCLRSCPYCHPGGLGQAGDTAPAK